MNRYNLTQGRFATAVSTLPPGVALPLGLTCANVLPGWMTLPMDVTLPKDVTLLRRTVE